MCIFRTVSCRASRLGPSVPFTDTLHTYCNETHLHTSRLSIQHKGLVGVTTVLLIKSTHSPGGEWKSATEPNKFCVIDSYVLIFAPLPLLLTLVIPKCRTNHCKIRLFKFVFQNKNLKPDSILEWSAVKSNSLPMSLAKDLDQARW